MKNQALFSLKDKSKKLKCRLLQFLFGTLRVNLDDCKDGQMDHLLFYGIFNSVSVTSKLLKHDNERL